MLIPSDEAALRPKLLQWFEEQDVSPKIVGEFDDGALLRVFGQAGAGIFPAPSVIEKEYLEEFGLVSIGRTDVLTEHYFVISAERRFTHPAVVAISSVAHQELFRKRVSRQTRASGQRKKRA